MPFKSNFFCEKGASRNQDPFKQDVATGSEKDLIHLDEQHGSRNYFIMPTSSSRCLSVGPNEKRAKFNKRTANNMRQTLGVLQVLAVKDVNSRLKVIK